MRADDKAEGVKKVGIAAPPETPVKEIEVSAKSTNSLRAEIDVPLNTLVRLHLKSTDKEHGFELKSMKDSCVKFQGRSACDARVLCDKAASWNSAVASFCGMGHGR
jgi:heme/copper-type cytochrome/quinol oxidase subunit 2